MRYVDTHSHLFAEEFDLDRTEVIQRSIDVGVDRIFLPNIDTETIPSMLTLVNQFPNTCFAMLGLHPCSVKDDFISVLEKMKELFSKHKFWAIGETGVDLYWDKSTKDIQIQAFDIQVNWAIEMDLPIVIHSRDSIEEILTHLQSYKGKVKGIFHCFSGTHKQAEQIIDLGFLMGIGGVLTFKNSGMREVVKELPMEYLLLETDSPYLAPVPFRGKRNESSYLKAVAECLAEIKGISIAEIAASTTANALRIFKMS